MSHEAFKWKQTSRKLSPHPVDTIIKNNRDLLKGIVALLLQIVAIVPNPIHIHI